MFVRSLSLACTVALAVSGATPALAAEPIELTIKGHRFQPERIEVPAGKPFELLVRNQDATPEEFESHDLHREKVIMGNGTAKIRFGALKPGEYAFVGEFHEATAKGVIVAK